MTNSFLQVINDSPDIFCNSFGIAVSTSDMCMCQLCLDDEEIASALSFSGDYCGELVAVIKRKDIKSFSSGILNYFGIQNDMDTSAVFAEILNIYSGSLATLINRTGKHVNIGTPRKLLDGYPTEQCFNTVRFYLAGGAILKLYFLEQTA